jgi:hypothetical protein
VVLLQVRHVPRHVSLALRKHPLHFANLVFLLVYASRACCVKNTSDVKNTSEGKCKKFYT